MNSPIRITAIVCTHNRSKVLRAAIESLVTQTLPTGCGWEILVVDNNSTDETRKVVEEFEERYPGLIRYCFESRQGISYARNAGVQNANGEIVAFLDDDETAGVGWLKSLTANLHGDEWVGAGGRILAVATMPLPRWLTANSDFTNGPLPSFDRGLDAGELKEPPFSANMAFRREVFDKLGGFRTDLGRSGQGLFSNEDTEYGRRLMRAGLHLRYEPSAVTHHPVHESRLHKQYYLTWWFNKGRSDVREFGTEPTANHVLGIPGRFLPSLVWLTVRWMVSIDPVQRFKWKMQVWNIIGQMVESRAQWLNAKRIDLEGGAERKVPDRRSQ
jgi:glycosyltransferase involved in cell wall biosynthesis